MSIDTNTIKERAAVETAVTVKLGMDLHAADVVVCAQEEGDSTGQRDPFGLARDQLLAEAILALTVPVGSNAAKAFRSAGADRNFNIPLLYADPNHWPTNDRPPRAGFDVVSWYHSDMHEMGFVYMYGMYDQFVALLNP